MASVGQEAVLEDSCHRRKTYCSRGFDEKKVLLLRGSFTLCMAWSVALTQVMVSQSSEEASSELNFGHWIWYYIAWRVCVNQRLLLISNNTRESRSDRSDICRLAPWLADCGEPLEHCQLMRTLRCPHIKAYSSHNLRYWVPKSDPIPTPSVIKKVLTVRVIRNTSQR